MAAKTVVVSVLYDQAPQEKPQGPLTLPQRGVTATVFKQEQHKDIKQSIKGKI